MAVKNTGRADHDAGRPRGARPHPERHRRAGRRARPGHGDQEACRSTARRRSSSTSRRASRCSRPASRSSTCSRRTAAAARSACSAAPASARPSRSWSSSTTSPRSTAASRCSPASASARARATTSTTRWRSRSCPIGDSVLSKTALVYGQMNEPPGARARVALSALTVRRVLPRRGRAGRAAVRRQHLPLHPGGLRGVGAPRPHPERRRLPADAVDRDGRAAGAHHLDQQGLDHLGAGHLRARRRPHRPGAGDRVRPPRRDDGALARASRSSASTRPSIRSTRRRRFCRPQVVGEEHYKVAREVQSDPAALQGAAGHHRHPRHGRAVRGRQADRAARPQDPEVPVAAVLRRRDVHRLRPASTSSSRTPSAASRRSSTASATTSPSRRST